MKIQYVKADQQYMKLVVNGVFITTMLLKEKEFLHQYGKEIAKSEITKQVEFLREQYKDLVTAKKAGELPDNELAIAGQLLNAIAAMGKKYNELLSTIK